jgi:hypothetical protein
MTEEERQQMLRNRSQMIGAAQGPLTLGSGGSVPAFPSTLSNINPEPTAPLIPFRGGGTAEMGVGGAQVNYPSRLGLSGGSYGPREMGARDFAPATLPQAQPTEMLRQQFTNPFRTPSERFGSSLTEGLTALPPTTSLPIDQGPLSANINAPMSAEAQGRQAIQTPRGTIYATSEQASNMMTPRTLAQQSSRSPAEQQALLAQMRERGSAIGQRLAGEEATRQQGLQQGYYAFRQGLEERRAQEALSTAGGRSPQVSRGAQALAEAERWKQAQAGRSPMDRGPFTIGGGGGPQPATATTTPRPSMAGPSTMGMGASAFSYTPFAQTMQQQEEPALGGFMAAINPSQVDRRFRPFPFGMRRFGMT